MPLRVVLVDDDDRYRAVARRSLMAEGVDVVAEVVTGSEVTGVVAQCQPDVVLLDIGLPDVDGLEVARRLQGEGGPSMVILISTRDVAYGDRVAAGLAAGYLPKAELSLPAILKLLHQAP